MVVFVFLLLSLLLALFGPSTSLYVVFSCLVGFGYLAYVSPGTHQRFLLRLGQPAHVQVSSMSVEDPSGGEMINVVG